MAGSRTSTRRSFLSSGALLAAPVAAGLLPAARRSDDTRARLEQLQDEAAIGELHRGWLRQVNADAGHALLHASVRRIVPEPAAEPQRLEFTADRRGAIGRYDYRIETQTVLAADCTLAQMALAQGFGTIRGSERRWITMRYRKSGDRWEIVAVVLAPSDASRYSRI